MPITLATLTTDERDGIDATRGALDANAVWVQYVCQTGPGEHDPDKEPDPHVRPSHRALHGTVWRLDDPSAPIPPIAMGCRCAIRYVAAPETAAEGLLPEAPSEPVSDPREPAREWLDANVPNWEKVARAAADAPPQLAEAAAFNEARKLGIDRETARLALFAQPYPTPSPEPLGLGPLSGVGRAGRLLAERWLAGDLEAGAELARKYPATYARLLRERGPA